MPGAKKSAAKGDAGKKKSKVEAKKEKIELVPAMKEDEEEMPGLEPDLESSEESDGAEDGLLDGIVDTKPKSTKKMKVIEVDDRERQIEDLLFGGAQGAGLFGPDSEDDESSSSFGDNGMDDSSEEEGDSTFIIGEESEKRRKRMLEEMGPAKKKAKVSEEEVKAAWTDDDDSEETVNIVRSQRSRKLRKVEGETHVSGSAYQQRLREQHSTIFGGAKPAWAQVNPEENEMDTETKKMLASTGALVGSKNGIDVLATDRIKLSQMSDANKSSVSKAAVQVVQWHPNGGLLITAGFDKTLRLFDIDGLKNTRLQSALFNDFPISGASCSPDGTEIYVVGIGHELFVYDILKAKIDRVDRISGAVEEKYKTVVSNNKYIVVLGGKGRIHLISNKTKQWVKTLKMSGAVVTAAFTADGKSLYTAGKRGEIYLWDISSSFACLRRFSDEGTGPIRRIALSKNGEWLAAGRDNGIVNIYKIAGPESESFYASTNPKPTKTIDNLTTTISSLEFNHDSQILAIASHTVRNKIRLVHIPSFRVFQNWPIENTNVGRVTCLSFSPESSWLAVGNIRGNVRLFKLHHYHPASKK